MPYVWDIDVSMEKPVINFVEFQGYFIRSNDATTANSITKET